MWDKAQGKFECYNRWKSHWCFRDYDDCARPRSNNLLICPMVVLNRLLSPRFFYPIEFRLYLRIKSTFLPVRERHPPIIRAGLVFALKFVLPEHSKIVLH